MIPSESPQDHHPLPFLKAIGVPATATYRGEKHKAFVFISGHEKGPGVYHPAIEVYIEGLHQFVPREELELFEGPAPSDAADEVRVMAVSIRRGKRVYRAMNSVDLHMGEYPASIVGEGDNNVFGTEVFTKGPRRAAWRQLMREMSSGFDEGHISFGGKVPSSKIEIDFSGNGIEPLLKVLIRFVGL
ncbi:MAG: hypothetical protein ABSD72_17775 [Terracidiphilus sp.]